MSPRRADRRRLAAVAATCLVSVALPMAAVGAKEKVKSAPPQPAPVEFQYSVSIPTIDAVGSSIDSERIAEILSGNVVDHADALADLDATSITVPEITIEITSTDGDTDHDASITFSDLVLDNVVDGKAASVRLAGASLAAEDTTAQFGAMSAANFNITGLLGLYGLVDHGGRTEMEVIYTDLVSEGGTLESEDAKCTIGGVSGAEFKARPLKTPLVEIMAIAQEMEDAGDDVDPALIGRFINIYADMMTAFETSELTFDGLSCDGVNDDGKPLLVSIGGMTMGAMRPGLYPAISMDNMTIDLKDEGSMLIGNVTMKAMDLTSTIAALESAPERVDEAWLEANMRKLFPAMEGFSMSGLDFDLPDPDNADARMQGSLAAADLTLANYVNGIPTNIDLTVDNVQAVLPTDSDDETFEQLRALGLDDFNVSFRIAASWDESSSTIVVEEVSMSGVDLASVLLAGTITNATSALFGDDAGAALAAGMGVAVKGIDLTVNDAGLADIILAFVAAEQGGTPESLRPVFAGLAQGGVIGLLGGTPDAAKVGEALNAFISGKAKTLVIGVDAKNDPGLGMMDFMAAEQNPTSLLDKVNVSAEAR